MRIFNGSQQIKEKLPNSVITLGNFDGVHLAHQRIISMLKERAISLGGLSVIYTFSPHPLEIIGKNSSLLTITPLEEKLRLFDALGIDIAIIEEFTHQFAQKEAEEFVKEIFVELLGVAEVIVGPKFNFGKERKGNLNLLREMGKHYGFSLKVAEPVYINNTLVSSTKIRELILKGKVRDAASFIGRPYTLKGKVIKGKKRGRLLGFPTANLEIDSNLFPKEGIYAVKANFEGGNYPGVLNIGYNPTFDENALSLEVHILDFKGDIYGETLTLSFKERLRDEKRFSSPQELSEQIAKDVDTARALFKEEEKA